MKAFVPVGIVASKKHASQLNPRSMRHFATKFFQLTLFRRESIGGGLSADCSRQGLLTREC